MTSLLKARMCDGDGGEAWRRGWQAFQTERGFAEALRLSASGINVDAPTVATRAHLGERTHRHEKLVEYATRGQLSAAAIATTPERRGTSGGKARSCGFDAIAVPCRATLLVRGERDVRAPWESDEPAEHLIRERGFRRRGRCLAHRLRGYVDRCAQLERPGLHPVSAAPS